MAMVCGLDLHRSQITFDALIVESGEVWRGKLCRPDRARLRRWLNDDVARRAGAGPVAIAVEGCNGWRYVVEELAAAGFEAHLAEPADTQAARGPKKRAKTDRADSRLQRELLAAGRLPESWIPPFDVLEWRERTRMYQTLASERRMWVQRIHAEMFQHGLPVPAESITAASTRAWLCAETVPLSTAARDRVAVAYRMIDAADNEIIPLRRQLHRFAARQPACRALTDTFFGIGPICAVVVWAELGDCRRFTNSDQVVRHSGLDITVHDSNGARPGGRLSRQGPSTLRWALFEAAKCGARTNSPDYSYYQQVKSRHDGKIAAMSLARKLIRRCYHTLRTMDPEMVYAMPDD